MKCRGGLVAAGAALFLCTVPLFAHAASFNVLHAFTRGEDGGAPYASLLQDSAGNLYGTTANGGGSGCSGEGCGTVFRVAPDGTETILYAFQGGSDGAGPGGALIMDGSDNLYGMTAQGGDPHCLYSEKPYGCGTVFKITPDGAETTLHIFTGGKDGAEPIATLAMDAAGDLFGATLDGGAVGAKGKAACGERRGCGTVFKLAADGTKTLLHAFAGGEDGAVPFGNVVLDSAGNLYGATNEGGAGACTWGCGTVFRISPDGKEKVLYRFQGGSDGQAPGGLVMNAAGDLFGATEYGGGTTCKCGTVFSVTPKGHERVLYRFQGGNDGIEPLYSPLAIDAAGNLYGTTSQGGGKGCAGSGCGTIFELSTDNKESVLYAFTGGTGGYFPIGGVILDGSGDLFGTTYSGGNANCPDSNNNGCGTVFELTN